MEKAKKPDESFKITKKTFITKQENINDLYTMEIKPIGSGNFGIVKKAVHKVSKQERAIKIIPKSKIRDLTRFKSEVDILRTVVYLFALFEPAHKKLRRTIRIL